MADVLIKVGTTQNNLVDMPNPSKMEWSLQDVSAGDSGRDDTGYMYKALVTQKQKLVLAWSALSPSKASQILNAFNHEYFYVRYFDPLANSYVIKEMYVGDRTAPVKIWSDNQKIYETLSFDVIER